MNILVLCTGNSARSILLESILTYRSDGRVTGFSAGSRPAGKVHPQAIKLLTEQGYPTDRLSSKTWDRFAEAGAPQMDVVITVCDSAAAEECPYWPGAPVMGHWGIPDPAAAPPEDQPRAFAEAYATLHGKAMQLLEEQIEDMDAATLTATLRRIGH